MLAPKTRRGIDNHPPPPKKKKKTCSLPPTTVATAKHRKKQSHLRRSCPKRQPQHVYIREVLRQARTPTAYCKPLPSLAMGCGTLKEMSGCAGLTLLFTKPAAISPS
ncbi:hypothetical protein, unlikely [Trypanosoma brucei gambiense DAL972]|uniref:Uncharacterized protein n=1 Tax=Trypanosoma brucei gambiense (strain MHOM/CI/86/DAL972) TaxID=679716 RepID=D0A355_TRYB9|nr:hypothetical protein, unlikely [Trypanosoma brucei gambiense DAL972]CBH15699.1 hypothetical protein, unlikely [Trypanosoma brucei gambiense DAL972]|eukprot:XP_011777963.1 hypothetical protein, unlikely [Trypanosoma brucei gambiense DAL972]